MLCVSVHVTLLRAAIVTNITSEWFLSFVNRCNMSIQVTLLRRSVITNVTFKRFLSLVDCINVFIQFCDNSKYFATYFTSKCVIFFLLDLMYLIYYSYLICFSFWNLNVFFRTVSILNKFFICLMTNHDGCQIVMNFTLSFGGSRNLTLPHFKLKCIVLF